MDSDKLYLMSSFLPQTEESLDMILGAGEKMKQKMKHFINFPIVVYPYNIKKRTKICEGVAIFGNIHLFSKVTVVIY